MHFINDSSLIPKRIFFQGVAAILADDALRYLWDGHVFQKSLEIPAINKYLIHCQAPSPPCGFLSKQALS
jgi:hypothetical protein